MLRTAISAIALIGLGAAGAADAQMMEKPYQFQPRDRVGIAFSLEQIEREEDRASNSGGEVTQVVCGGASGQTGSATSNMACIFVGDGANAAVGTDQASEGDQSATSNTDVDAITDALNSGTASD